MCTELKGPFHLAVRTRGITLEEALSLIMRSHTVEYRIACTDETVTVEHVKSADRTQVQLPELVVKKISGILEKVSPNPRNAHLRAGDAKHPSTVIAFAKAWGATPRMQRKIQNTPSIRNIAMIIGLIERDKVSFDEAYTRAQSLNLRTVIRDHD